MKGDYESEVYERWGNTEAYREYTENYSKEKHKSTIEGMNNLFAEFAVCNGRGAVPDSDEAQTLVAKLQAYITENFYTCTKEILSGLGQMYISDERFKKNIDGHGQGTADFVAKAIAVYCN